MSIEKPNIRITKNREFGSTPYIECDYDPSNRRIFEHAFGDHTIYDWNHEGISIPENQACESSSFEIQLGTPDLVCAQPF